MSKRSKSKNWRGARPRAGGAELLRGLALGGALVFLAWAASLLLPGTDADAAAPRVVIRRVMTSNPSVCFKVDGAYYDWIELWNGGGEAANLGGWKLTDTGDLRSAWVLPDVEIAPGGTLVVYCDAMPEGYAGDALFTGFKLSSDGELLLLADPAQHTSAVQVPALRKGFVYQLDPDTGEYAAQPYGEMSDAEKAERAQAEGYNPNEVMISEVMPSNRSVLADADGDFSDWIELYNPKAEPVSLKDWALTDDDLKRAKWVFPECTLQPGGYLVVFASGKNRRDPGGELHASFRLSAKGETVRLSNAEGEVVSQVSYEAANPDQSLSRGVSGTFTGDIPPTPGAANVDPGPQSDLSKLVSNDLGLYINEIFYGGKGSDWVEVVNAGQQPADLSGMGLSDNPAKPRKWQFPEGASLPAGGYALVELTGGAEKQADRAARGNDGILATPEGAEAPVRVAPGYTADFGLSAGETLCLSTAAGKLIDRATLIGSYKGVSVGRASGYDAYRYFKAPTPGAQNAPDSYARVRREVALSPAPGVIHESSIQVTMATEPGVSIYYTTDGTAPTADSQVYAGPITLTENAQLRAAADPRDVMEPTQTVGSYIFGPHTLPVVSITGRAKDLTRSDSMMATGKKGTGADVYVEIFDPNNAQLISQACHMTLTGHSSRLQNSQKSFKLNARRANGDTRFRAKLFENRDYDTYKALVLRTSGQDYNKTHMLDSILTSLAEGTHVPYQETEVCVVYLNGQYWGLYNLREHIDGHSICQWEGWMDADSVTIIRGSGENAGASAGSSAQYKKLWQWQKSADLSKAENLELLRQSLDVENYLDYCALQIYANNQDLNNVRCYRSETEDPRWRFVVFDMDLSYLNRAKDPANNVKAWLSGTAGTITSQDTSLFKGLMKNSEVRDYFLTRMGELLASNFSGPAVTARIEARRDLIKDEMVYNCKRWKWKYSYWEKSVDRIVAYAQARPAQLIQYLQESFKLSDSDTQRYFGEALRVNAQAPEVAP